MDAGTARSSETPRSRQSEMMLQTSSDAFRSLRSNRGVTLIEMLLVIGLIALLSSMFVLRVDTLMKQSEIETLESEFWKAVAFAKQKAVYQKRPYLIHYDADVPAFVVTSGSESHPFKIDTSDFDAEAELAVVFKEALPQNGYILISGRLIMDREIEKCRFFPDGTCNPFSVEVTVGKFTSSLTIDPWTGSQITPPEKEKAGNG